MANSFIDHGNYIAYGYSAAALNVLGISFAFPVMHGKTRRGGLVFDVADLFKDCYVLPLAFHCALNGYRDHGFRDALIEACQKDAIPEGMLGKNYFSAKYKMKKRQSMAHSGHGYENEGGKKENATSLLFFTDARSIFPIGKATNKGHLGNIG